MTNKKLLKKALKCARSYGIKVYAVKSEQADYHSIARDIDSGKVTFCVSHKLNEAWTALYIMEMLLEAHKRTWVDISEGAAEAFSECIAKIAKRHKIETEE